MIGLTGPLASRCFKCIQLNEPDAYLERVAKSLPRVVALGNANIPTRTIGMWLRALMVKARSATRRPTWATLVCDRPPPTNLASPSGRGHSPLVLG